MTRKHSVTYSVEPQWRRGIGDNGWEICFPHQAMRFAIIQLTHWRQQGKQYRRQRVVATFCGRGAEARANNALQALIAHSKPKPANRLGKRMAEAGRKIIARSLTSSEYYNRKEQR